MTGYSLKSVKGFITADVLTAPDGNIQLGNVTISNNLGNVTQSDFLPFSLTINPENLVINVDAVEAGDDIHWLWTWQQTTLPYARATITNQQQLSVPLYKDGTYVFNNFASNVIHGNMTQDHHGFFKWIDGAGTENLIDWASNYTHTTASHASINSGANTTVQQYSFTVPSSITIPTLTAPNISYNVAVANNAYYLTGDAGEGTNVTLGPVRRGGTYTFNLDSTLSGHNFYITTDNGTGFVANTYVGEYTTGITGSRNDGSTGKTTLVWNVANTAPDTLFYQSAQDANIRGAITVKDLAVETNINGNPVVYFQHMHEGHKTPIEIKPIPTMVNQMCLVYDASLQEFVPQDMATYVDNTPSFKNKIREVAGTATLVAPSGVSLVPTVLVVENVSYLPLVGNKDGDIAFDSYTDTLYVWGSNTWNSTKPNAISAGSLTGTFNNMTVAGNILPSANITYNLGNSTNRWKDLYLSGTTIDLAGATIKTDVATGAITLIPQPTVAVPNPVGIVITASGTLSTVTTTAGVVTTANIANAVANSTVDVTAPSSFTSSVDTYIGNGTETNYTLTTAPADKNYTIVMVDGVMQPRSAYTVSGTTIALSSAASNGAVIEVTTMGGSVAAPAQTVPDMLSPFLFIGV